MTWTYVAIIWGVAFGWGGYQLWEWWKERRGRNTASAEVMRGLYALFMDPELVHAGTYIADMLTYAEIGRDRKKLTMEYVERTERAARQIIREREVLEACFRRDSEAAQ